MFKKIFKKKGQRGFTLVELLAVILILGIIAGIAIPSIGGIVKNSKADTTVANAQQLLSSARMAYSAGEELETGSKYSLDFLIKNGYMEQIVDPLNKNEAYDLTGSYVLFTDTATGSDKFKVTLKGTTKTYITAVNSNDLSKGGRSNVSN